jgi:ERO1-like protein alpha
MYNIQASPMLADFDYMTGNQDDNLRTRAAVLQLLSLRNKTECSEAFEGFNERSMFVTPGQEKLRDTMREKFRNVSAILDCIACESCRMQVGSLSA